MIVDLQTRRSRIKPQSPTPNDLALEITNRDYISFSSISSYQRCPLKYYFSYIAGVAPAFVSSSLVFGSSIHAALEHFWRQKLEGAPLPEIDEIVAVYEKAWQENATSKVRFGKTETAESLLDLARRILQAYLDSSLSTTEGTILGIEEELKAPAIDGCPDLLGRIDLITVCSNALRITDFKTSRSAWGVTNVAESTPQQLLYSELVKPLAESCGRPIEIEWIVLTKGKKAAIQRHRIVPEPQAAARAKSVVRSVWNAIAAGHFYPSPSAMNCSTCPYQNSCRTWEG